MESRGFVWAGVHAQAGEVRELAVRVFGHGAWGAGQVAVSGHTEQLRVFEPQVLRHQPYTLRTFGCVVKTLRF